LCISISVKGFEIVLERCIGKKNGINFKTAETKNLQHQTMNDFDAHSQAPMTWEKNLLQILQGQVMGG
jgi:hypothetical protein